MTESAPFTQLQDLSTALATLQRPARGAPCVAARSTLGSSLTCACGGVPKAVLPSTQPAGRLVWRYLDPPGECSSLPSATIARVATKLESHGRIPRGYLGLGLRLVARER